MLALPTMMYILKYIAMTVLSKGKEVLIVFPSQNNTLPSVITGKLVGDLCSSPSPKCVIGLVNITELPQLLHNKKNYFSDDSSVHPSATHSFICALGYKNMPYVYFPIHEK